MGKKIFWLFTFLLMLVSILLIGLSFWLYKHPKLDISITQSRSIQFKSSVMNWLFPICVLLGLFSLMKIVSTGRSIMGWLSENPIRFSLACSFAFMLIIVFYSYVSGVYDNFDQILIESHGIIFDVAVVGTLFALYERYKDRKEALEKNEQEKKAAIKRYTEEIDFIRGWHDEAAKHKTVGVVNKLIELKVFSPNLSDCYLPKADFHKLIFEKANFLSANLETANFNWTILKECRFDKANMKAIQLSNSTISRSFFLNSTLTNAVLIETTAVGCHFDAAALISCRLIKTDLSDASCRRTNFTDAVMKNVKLIGADLRKANFTRSDLSDAILDNAKVSDIDWFQYLLGIQVKGIEKLSQQYEIGGQKYEDEHGNIYFLVRKKQLEL